MLFKPVINIYCLIALFQILKKDDLEMLEELALFSLKARGQLGLRISKRLGSGSFAEVFKAEREGEQFAIKILKKGANVKQIIKYYMREVKGLRL